MKILYATALITLLISGCKKDGTEKRCDKGYTGKNCDQEITPAKIQVTKIEAIILPPFAPDGTNWDILGGKPDVYFIIRDDNTKNVVFKSTVGNDINTSLGCMLDAANDNVFINYPSNQYSIEAWDYDDTSDDDKMGGIIFIPYINGQKFPTKREVSCGSCNTKWNLIFTYLF